MTYHKNSLEQTQAIGTNAWQHNRDTTSKLERIVDEAAALAEKKKQIEPLHREAVAARNEAVRLQKDQERLIQEKGEELAANLFKGFKRQIMGSLEQHYPQAAQFLQQQFQQQNSRKHKHSL